MNALERLNTLHPDIINNFLEVGESSAIPVELQQFILQISWAAEIFQYERNITRAAKKLRQRILAEQRVSLSPRNCIERIYNALNFFSVDMNVSQEVWDRHTADRLVDLSKVAALKGDIKTAGQLEKDANFYRQRASNATQSGTRKITFLLTKELKADDLGFEDKNMKEIARKHNEGFYIKLISDLPLEKEDKRRLFADAELTEFEEIKDE